MTTWPPTWLGWTATHRGVDWGFADDIPDVWFGTPALLCDLAPTTRPDYLGIPRDEFWPRVGEKQGSPVRSWFRQMRAADFARDVRKWLVRRYSIGDAIISPYDDGSILYRFHRFTPYPEWTLFDTQAVVERVTRFANHLPGTSTLFFVNPADGRVLGAITNVAMPEQPGTYGAIERSTEPLVSSKVATSSRPFTFDDIHRLTHAPGIGLPSPVEGVRAPRSCSEVQLLIESRRRDGR